MTIMNEEVRSLETVTDKQFLVYESPRGLS